MCHELNSHSEPTLYSYTNMYSYYLINKYTYIYIIFRLVLLLNCTILSIIHKQ